MCSLDERRDAILIMLDLSAAFDTIDHDGLVHRSHTKLGINGTALGWLSSYLNCRTQRAVARTAMSVPRLVFYGVPQRLVLRPILLCIYTMLL